MEITDPLEQRVVNVVQDAIRRATGDAQLAVDKDDTMDTVPGWDSMTFMSVFAAVNEAFGIDPDFDDAIHFTAVPSLVTYLREQTTS